MEINTEMSKTIAKLKREVATLNEEVTRLKDENTKIKVESLRAQNLIIILEKRIADLQRFQVDHVNSLIMETQSFAWKMNLIDVIENNTNQIGEQPSMNLIANNCKRSRRISRSYQAPAQRRRSAPKNYREENGLHTIEEEYEPNNEVNTTQNTTQSIITSQCQSILDASTSIQSDDIFGTNSRSIASKSVASNKENQSSQSSKELKQTEYFGDLSSVKNVHSVTSRHKKQNVVNHSNGNIGMSGVVSSTPYKRIVNGTNTGQLISTVLSESDVCETEATYNANTRSKRIRTTPKSIPTLSNDSTTGTETKSVEIVTSKRTKNTVKISSNLSSDSTAFETDTMPIDLRNTRPKRNASMAISFLEPKLNTKLRRPLTMEPNVKEKSKRN